MQLLPSFVRVVSYVPWYVYKCTCTAVSGRCRHRHRTDRCAGAGAGVQVPVPVPVPVPVVRFLDPAPPVPVICSNLPLWRSRKTEPGMTAGEA